MSKQLTFSEDLPLAGLASWRVWQNVVQFVKQALHFASSLPLGHLVAYAKFWRSTVVTAASSECSRVVGVTLQACDTVVLHRVVMGGRHIYVCQSKGFV
jgi:hypothetical protein